MSIPGRYGSPPQGRDSPPGGLVGDGMACERCENKRGVLECTNCAALYCLECSTVVHQGRMAQHKLTIVGEVCVRCEAKKGKLQCLDCKGSKYTLYCLECHSLVHQGRIARHRVKTVFGHEVPGFMGGRDSQMESSDLGHFEQRRDRYTASRESPDPDRGYHSNSRSPLRGVRESSPYHRRNADTHSSSSYRSYSDESRVASASERVLSQGSPGDQSYRSRSPGVYHQDRDRSRSPTDIPQVLSPVQSHYSSAAAGRHADDRARSPGSYYGREGVESSGGHFGSRSHSPSLEKRPSHKTYSSHSQSGRYQSHSPSPDNQLSRREKRKHPSSHVQQISTLSSHTSHKRARSRSPSPYASGHAQHSSETSVQVLTTIVTNSQQYPVTDPMPIGYSQQPPAQTGYAIQTSTQSSYPVQTQTQPGYPAYPQGQSGYPAQPPTQGGYPGYPGAQYGHPQTTSEYPGQLQTATGYPAQPQIEYRYPVQPQAGSAYPVSHTQGGDMYGIPTTNYPHQQAGSMYPVPQAQGAPGFPRPSAPQQYTNPGPQPQGAPGFPRPPAPQQYPHPVPQPQGAPGFPRPPAPQQYTHPVPQPQGAPGFHRPPHPVPQPQGAPGFHRPPHPVPQPQGAPGFHRPPHPVPQPQGAPGFHRPPHPVPQPQGAPGFPRPPAPQQYTHPRNPRPSAQQQYTNPGDKTASKPTPQARRVIQVPVEKASNLAKKSKEASQKEALDALKGASKWLQVPEKIKDKIGRKLNGGGCTLCTFQGKDVHVHIIRTHAPWYIVGASACWQCKVFVHVLDLDEHLKSKGHRSTDYRTDFLIQWGYLICGALHFLASKFKCANLLELWQFVKQNKLHPHQNQTVKIFSSREKQWFSWVAMYFPELAEPGGNGGPGYCSPPASILSLINWDILCRMLAVLSDEDRFAFRSCCKPLRPDGSEIEDLKLEYKLRRSGRNITGPAPNKMAAIEGSTSKIDGQKEGTSREGGSKEGTSKEGGSKEGTSTKGTNKGGGSKDGHSSMKEIVVPYSSDKKKWIFKIDGAVCDTCTTSDRKYIHKVISHLPWFVEGNTACWNCESQEISKTTEHCNYEGHLLNFSQYKKIQWVYLMCGSLHFLAEKFNCSSLEELLTFVRKHRLFPMVPFRTGFTEATTKTLLSVERYFPKLASAGRIAGPLRVSPPTSILCLSDHRILCCLLSALGTEDQERFRSHVELTSAGGTAILFPEACILARIEKYAETEPLVKKRTEAAESEPMDESVGENTTNDSERDGLKQTSTSDNMSEKEIDGPPKSEPTTEAMPIGGSVDDSLKQTSTNQESSEKEICGPSKPVLTTEIRKTTWSFSPAAILCKKCKGWGRKYKHKLEVHLPWWFEGRNACWLCEDSGYQSGCCHTKVVGRDQANTIRWGLLFCGALHFFAEKFNCHSLLELLEFVRECELYPTTTRSFDAFFPKQTCKFFRCVENFFPELATPGRLPGPLTPDPPTSILCLSHYNIICHLLTGLSYEDRLIFKTFRISKTPDGRSVTDITKEINLRQEMHQKGKTLKTEQALDSPRKEVRKEGSPTGKVGETSSASKHDSQDDLPDPKEELLKDAVGEDDESPRQSGVEDGTEDLGKTVPEATAEQDKESTRIINDKEDGMKDEDAEEEKDRVSEDVANEDIAEPEEDAAKGNEHASVDDKDQPEERCLQDDESKIGLDEGNTMDCSEDLGEAQVTSDATATEASREAGGMSVEEAIDQHLRGDSEIDNTEEDAERVHAEKGHAEKIDGEPVVIPNDQEDATESSVQDNEMEENPIVIGESMATNAEHVTAVTMDETQEIDNLIIDEPSVDDTASESNLLDDQYELESNESGQMSSEMEVLDEYVGSDEEEDAEAAGSPAGSPAGSSDQPQSVLTDSVVEIVEKEKGVQETEAPGSEDPVPELASKEEVTEPPAPRYSFRRKRKN